MFHIKKCAKRFKRLFAPLLPVLPFGVIESWNDLDPRLYHAVHIFWLKFYGLWYNNSSAKTIMFWIQMIYALIVLWLVCFLPGFGEVVYLLKRSDNIGNVAEGLYLFLSEMFTYVKLAVFWRNKNKVFALLEYLHCDEFRPQGAEHRRILRESIKMGRNIMTYYSTMCVCAVSVGILMPITENFDVLPTNVEYPYFNVYASPAYQLLYVHHIYYKPATCIIDGVMDTILASSIASALGQIEILAYNLRNFDKEASKLANQGCSRKGYDITASMDSFIRRVLRKSIKHHIAIIRYVSLIEDAFSLASALQFMLSASVLCLVGIQFLSIEEPASHPLQIMWMIIYLTCMLIEFFILCWFGNELIWQSSNLRHAAFDGPWMTTEATTRKYIIVFLERCKKPMQVSAGKIFTLSLETYTVLINWSYKAFAVMKTMKT